jgi:hypothetical protein
MKTALIAGWICFGLEAVIVTTMLLSPKGGDAAGAEMAKGFGLLFAPFVAILGIVLLWGQLTRHPYGVWGGAILAGIPFVVGLCLALPNFIPNFSRMAFHSNVGKYDDPRVTQIAKAMLAGDFAKQRELVKAGNINWTARDRNGVTLLGRAVKMNQDMFAGPEKLEGLRILLAAGAPLAPDALRTEEFSNTDSLLLVAAAGSKAGILEALLAAGGDPNSKDTDGTPLVFLSYIDLERLQLLIKYGVDVNETDPDPMRNRQSLVEHFAERGEEEAVQWLVAHGARRNEKQTTANR